MELQKRLGLQQSRASPPAQRKSEDFSFSGGAMSEGERKLWRAVLEQAYEDAEMCAIGDETGSEPFECARARRYLRADSPYEITNLKLVSEFANVPADRVVLWARTQYPLTA
jgi:hypothetical protein